MAADLAKPLLKCAAHRRHADVVGDVSAIVRNCEDPLRARVFQCAGEAVDRSAHFSGSILCLWGRENDLDSIRIAGGLRKGFGILLVCQGNLPPLGPLAVTLLPHREELLWPAHLPDATQLDVA